MTYPINVNIPAANNFPGDDQPEMKTNFGNINSYLKVDHTDPAAAGAGYHKQVTIYSNNTPAIPTSPPVLFTANDAFSTPQLFWYSGNTAKTSDQYTAGSDGSTYLFGGMIIKWGNVALPGTGFNQPVTFNTAFPNNCYAVVVTPSTSTSATVSYVTALSTSGFTAVKSSSSAAFSIYYYAIGN